jgi:hypothetical protein
MPEQQLSLATPPASMPRWTECRVYPRTDCDLRSICQPASGPGSDESRWAASVRNISQGGVLLQIRRRYEKGTGLAIVLPVRGGQDVATFFARVVRVTTVGVGLWSLGCQFVSPMSEDELKQVLMPPGRNTIHGVQLHIATASGKTVRCRFKQLRIAQPWPVSAGQTLLIRSRAQSSPWTLHVHLTACRKQGDRWLLWGKLPHGASDADVLHKLSVVQ